jgi:hypothetical protein
MQLPPQEQLKAIGDSVAIPTAVLAWIKAITIPDAAALAALLYTLLRIGELLHGWLKKRKRK